MGDLLSQLAASDRRVLERLSQRGQAWIVGGWVRDKLQGLNPTENISGFMGVDHG